MVGFITERDLDQAEAAFPGIGRFFESLTRKPRTFLDLVCLFERWRQPASAPEPGGDRLERRARTGRPQPRVLQ